MNPVSKLNEMRQGLVYNVKSRTGADHEPEYTVSVEVIHTTIYYSMKSSISPFSQVDGEIFLGKGRSKKLARIKGAEAALDAHNTKRKSDSLSGGNGGQSDFVSSESVLNLSKQKPQNPIVELNELRPGIIYRLKGRTGPDHDPVFTVTVQVSHFSNNNSNFTQISPWSQVDGRQFVGHGRSKKLAREKAAEAALNFTHNKKQLLGEGTVVSNAHEPQNAVTILNEVRPGLNYNFEDRTGTDHEPIFTVAVEVIW